MSTVWEANPEYGLEIPDILQITNPEPITLVISENATAGGATASSFIYTQAVAASTWIITHNLGYNPNITILDNLGNTIEGQVAMTSLTTTTITFSQAITGVAYLS
jgi:hypothetical protein